MAPRFCDLPSRLSGHFPEYFQNLAIGSGEATDQRAGTPGNQVKDRRIRVWRQLKDSLTVDGNAAAIDAILELRDGISSLPVLVGNRELGRQGQVEREIHLRTGLNEVLAPVYDELQSTAPALFSAMLDECLPGATFDNNPPRLDATTLHDVTAELLAAGLSAERFARPVLQR